MFVRKLILILVTASLLLAACTASPSAETGKLQAVATTSIVADVVTQIGGERVTVTMLLPLGADPHTFEPRPQDAVAIAKADLVFANGAGLEEFLHPLLESAGAEEKLVEVSAGIELLKMGEHEAEQEAEGHAHEEGDPHTWMDPNNVIVWTQNIADALVEADPANAKTYQVNAEAYIASLTELDGWIRTQVEQIPAERRKMVSDHLAFGYFADEYGLEQVGALIGAFSTNAAPSAQELAALEDKIKEQGVLAVFVGKTVNPALAEQVAQDTGTKLVFLYTGSLSEPGGEADSYLAFMRYNVNAIAEALK